MNTTDIRARLALRRAEIMSIINKVDKHVTYREEALDRDSGERALELENLDVLFAIDRETRLELRQINDAIERIDIGRYGFCSECGAAIGAERLAALPSIDSCISCAESGEAKARVS